MYIYVYTQTSLERVDGGVICSQQRALGSVGRKRQPPMLHPHVIAH